MPGPLHLQNKNRSSIFQRPQLLQLLGLFQRRLLPPGELQQKLPPIRVNPQMQIIWLVGRKILLPMMRNHRSGKINRPPRSIENHLHQIRIAHIRPRRKLRRRRRHVVGAESLAFSPIHRQSPARSPAHRPAHSRQFHTADSSPPPRCDPSRSDDPRWSSPRASQTAAALRRCAHHPSPRSLPGSFDTFSPDPQRAEPTAGPFHWRQFLLGNEWTRTGRE